MDAAALQEAHRRFAAGAFNECWELIDLPARTAAEEREMIRRAEVSFWHWQKIDDRTPKNDAIGYWQLARVYALAGEAAKAVFYAETGLGIARTHALGPFLEAYAWESLARAHAAASQSEQCLAALKSARELVADIAESSEASALQADLDSIQVP